MDQCEEGFDLEGAQGDFPEGCKYATVLFGGGWGGFFIGNAIVKKHINMNT